MGDNAWLERRGCHRTNGHVERHGRGFAPAFRLSSRLHLVYYRQPSPEVRVTQPSPVPD